MERTKYAAIAEKDAARYLRECESFAVRVRTLLRLGMGPTFRIPYEYECKIGLQDAKQVHSMCAVTIAAIS